ncbi:MAG: TraR/DksA family transcriptional regulator [Chitinophagales bacterium]|nr:TraR/DksA family transcriptional regulator [Chitinophagales bacterium]
MAAKEKTRYSDSELVEFKDLIVKKIEESRAELKDYQDQISKKNTGSSDTDYKFNGLEDSSLLVEREYLSQQASRQAKFISHLEKALVRIENKTYGICRETGKLISPERLRIVPHATLSIEAKKSQNK